MRLKRWLNLLSIHISIHWLFPPFFGGVADDKKNNNKQWGFYFVLLAMMRDPAKFGWHYWSNTAHLPQLNVAWYGNLYYVCLPFHSLKSSMNDIKRMEREERWQKVCMYILCFLKTSFYFFLRFATRDCEV